MSPIATYERMEAAMLVAKVDRRSLSSLSCEATS